MRVAALRASGLLPDTRAEGLAQVDGWDRLTRLAARVTGTAAFIGVADEDDLVRMSGWAPDGTPVPDERLPLSRCLVRHVIGGDLPLVVHDARRDPRLHAVDRTAAFGVVAFAGFPLRAPDGTVLGSFAAVSGVPQQWDDATLDALADLTATAEVEVALRLRNRELRDRDTCLSNVMAAARSTAVVITDGHGTIRTFSAGAENVLGCRADEVVDRVSLASFMPAHGRIDRLLTRLAGAGVSEGELRRWDGRVVPVSLVVTPFADADGTPAYLVTAADITEKRRGERALQDALDKQLEAVRRLEELDRAKSAFVANTSHELRTPVTSILGYTAMLAAGAFGELTARQAEALTRVERNSHRLRRLVDDLLTLSHVESGRFVVDPTDVDVADLGIRACQPVQEQVARRGQRLELDLPEGTVHADAAAMERVLTNLLDNAVKYTPDGGTVALAAYAEAGGTVFEVTDTGIGIPEDEQPGLFTQFYRASANRDLAIEGTGLGLAISRAIVEAHKGTIRVQSRVGVGTKVTVTLPAGG